MSQTAIRPSELHEEYQQLKAHDIRAMFVDTILLERNCPLCGEKSFQNYAEKSFLKYRQCDACALVYLGFLPPRDVVENYYQSASSSSYFHEKILASTEANRRALFEERFLKIESLPIEKHSLLDLGSSIGTFVKVLQDKGWSAIGLEPNQAACHYGQKNGRLIASDFSSPVFKEESSFGVVTAWEVIAHLYDPLPYLEKALSFLEPNGFLILTTPNVEALEYRLLGENHHNMGFPFLQFFSTKTLPILFEKLKLSVSEISTPGKMDVETIRDFFKTQKIDWPPAIADVLFSENRRDEQLRQEFQKALIHTQQSGHLFAIAKKK